DLLLAISEHTRADFIEHLAIPADRVVAVGTGVPARFSPAPDRAAAIRAAVESVPGLRAGFAMYTGGSDARKNVEGLLAAWALVDPALRARHQLAVVFKLHGTHGEHLARVAEELGVADDVVFTGFVDDDVLLAMYRSTDLFVFPSLYEGFGLPVAEALACGAVSIASDTSSLPEVLPDPDARFDPKDPTAIAAAITRGLTESAFRERALRTAQAVDHSWEGVVAATERAYGSLAARLR
ncbi:MAG: glycosyltransferase family 4 protein, partial [Microbacteriaceae bacterium]|nr:glycosyltransferase family 4 protein [Microbacteriaceae bacterium]